MGMPAAPIAAESSIVDIARDSSAGSVASGQQVVALPAPSRRAYDLLAKQPVSLLGLAVLERSLVVVLTPTEN